jgi:hypothetical protein
MNEENNQSNQQIIQIQPQLQSVRTDNDDMGSEKRKCCGEDGIISTFFKMICFPFESIFFELLSHLFGEGWFYNSLKWTWQNNGHPVYYECYSKLICGLKFCNGDDCCNDDCCKSFIFFVPICL